MNDNIVHWTAATVLLIAISYLIGAVVGFGDGRLTMQQRAYEHGYGYYITNSQGRSTFKWKGEE